MSDNGVRGQVTEWHAIDAAYREVQRRDGGLERQAYHWKLAAAACFWLLVGTLGLTGWMVVTQRQVQAFVQVVQTNEQGQVVQMGVPVDLLRYTPQDGQWMDMLTQWVRHVRWRGTDPVLAKQQWGTAYRHTCGQARRLLQAYEEHEKPFQAGKKLVMVEVKSVTKTPVPQSYQIVWVETQTETAHPSVKTQVWNGTFTVGRTRPPTLADVLDNRLGLCVTAFDWSMQP